MLCFSHNHQAVYEQRAVLPQRSTAQFRSDLIVSPKTIVPKAANHFYDGGSLLFLMNRRTSLMLSG